MRPAAALGAPAFLLGALIFLFGALAPGRAQACADVVYLATPHLAQASLNPLNGQPIIIIHPSLPAMVGPAGMRFVLAHECAHHQLNHVAIALSLLKSDPLAIPYLTPSRELAADCQAARTLAASGDRDAILAGAAMMAGRGPFPTGANYPTGSQRAATIRRCGGLPGR